MHTHHLQQTCGGLPVRSRHQRVSRHSAQEALGIPESASGSRLIAEARKSVSEDEVSDDQLTIQVQGRARGPRRLGMAPRFREQYRMQIEQLGGVAVLLERRGTFSPRLLQMAPIGELPDQRDRSGQVDVPMCG